MTRETTGLPPVLPGAAAAISFLIAAGIALSVMRGEIVLLPTAVVLLIAGIGILRRRSWSAYGMAVFELAQLLILPMILLRSGSGSVEARRVALTVVTSVGLIVLFAAAGRSLARAVGDRGRAWPWIAISAVFSLSVVFMQPFTVPTSSMEDTLLIGDRILVQRILNPMPGRGDIVAFLYPVDRRQTLIKRVIGIPGDRIHLFGKTVYRNGAPLTEPYVVRRFPPDAYRDDFPAAVPHFPLGTAAQDMLARHVVGGEVVVPAGKYFVLGDNRDNSLDSRYWGFLDGADIIGKARLIYGSQSAAASDATASRAGGFERVRWERLFRTL